MYLPSYHEERDLHVMHELISAHSLGAWVTLGADGLNANTCRSCLTGPGGEYGTLRAHVSRANTVWQDFSITVPSVVMFQGPQSYSTPSWYPGKQADGKVVPTWDYVVVHAYGTPSVIQDRDWILQAITDLTNQSELARTEPWKVSDAPHEFIERLARAIVGFEIPITRLLGRWKLSQDEALPDRVGTASGLLEVGDPNSVALAPLVTERIT